MKAKYKHYGSDCMIYDQVICEDNIVVTARTYASSWFDAEPETTVKLCLTNAEARRLFYSTCSQLEEDRHYVCVYKEV